MKCSALILAVALLSSCISLAEPLPLATAHAAPDLATYDLRRVGLMPFSGADLSHDHARTLQDAFLLELGAVASFELVRLTDTDLDEVRDSEPYRRGSYDPRTLLELAYRYRLDAVLIASVTQVNVYPPQVLGLSLDLVSCETGMVIWTASLRADAGDAYARSRLDDFQRSRADVGSETASDLTLISPTLFSRFAASEVAKTF